MDTRPQTGVFLLAIDYDIPLTNPTISQDIRNLLGIWGGLFIGNMRQIGYPNLEGEELFENYGVDYNCTSF